MHTQNAPGATGDQPTGEPSASLAISATSAGNLTRLERRRAELEAEGFNASAWAREHGFNESTVHGVLSGSRKGRYGKAHEIAVALGLKDGKPAEAEAA